MSDVPYAPPDPGAIKIWFAQIYGKLDEVRAAIFAKSGWAIFRTHTHSTDALLSNPTLEGIRSTIGQIDNTMQQWREANALDAATAQFYSDNRVMVEQQLSSLRADIIQRRPTFWEDVLHTIGHLLQLVRKFLPALPAILLKALGIHIAPLQQHLQDKSEEMDDLIDSLLRR